MDIRSRLFAPCFTVGADGVPNGIDFSAFVANVLLYDRYILQSSRLRELPALLALWGADGVGRLLQSGALDIHCDAVVVARSGDGDPVQRLGAGRIRLARLDYGVVRAANARQMVSDAMREALTAVGISGKIAIRLKEQLGKRVLTSNPRDGTLAHEQLVQDLKASSPVLKQSMLTALTRMTGVKTPSDRVELSFEFEEGRGFAATTNIAGIAGLSDGVAREVILSGIGGVAGLNERVARMEVFNAVCGFKEAELPVLDSRLTFLLSQLNADAPRQRFTRILHAVGLPDLPDSPTNVNLDRLLEVRDSAEAREFRAWIWAADSANEAEIKDRFTSIRAKLGLRASSAGGRVLRWLASTGLGMIPPCGPMLGGMAGLLDTFLVDKVLPRSGVLAFLSEQYPSIYRET